jgi:hypothetical protein
MAPVRGWLARAERLLEGQEETPAHAWLAVVRTYERMLTGDVQGARPWSERAIEVGSRCDAAACAVGRVAAARLRILDGDVAEGLALLDEAGVAAVSGDLDPLSTGFVYCELVCALQGPRSRRSCGVDVVTPTAMPPHRSSMSQPPRRMTRLRYTTTTPGLAAAPGRRGESAVPGSTASTGRT